MARTTARTWPVLDCLGACLSASVVVCEREKAADAAAQLLPDRVAVTSPDGSNEFHKAGLGTLAGRLVTIWPDADPTRLEIHRGRVAGANWHHARSRRRGSVGYGNGDGRPQNGWAIRGSEVVGLVEGSP